MIRALSSLLALMLTVQTSGQTTQVSGFVSPCPNVFTYQTSEAESNKWHGTLHLNTDTTLYALWLDIVLDNKANILGNWVGEVTTNDNKNFKIENTKMTISPDEPLEVPFFIQYKAGDTPPKLESIRFNGKEICQVETPEIVPGIYREVGPEVTTPTTSRPAGTATSRNYNKQQTTLRAQYWYQTEKPQTTKNSLFWTQTTPAATTSTTLKPQYFTEERTTESTTLKPQYWQQTAATLKPIYWTQAQTEVKQQTTTVRTPDWSYVKADNNTVKPTTQRWSQTKTEATPHTTTEQNSVSKVQNWSYSQTNDRNRTENSQTQLQVQNNQKTTSVNSYVIQNDIKQQTTLNPPVWPNVKVADNQSSKGPRPNNSQIEVKQVGQTQYWSKLPADNITGAAEVPSETDSTLYGWSGNQQRVPDSVLQNPPYAKISIKQAESTKTRDQVKDTPLYVRPEDRQTISGVTFAANNNLGNRPLTYSGVGSEIRQPAGPVDSYHQTTEQWLQNTGENRPVKIPGENGVQKQSWSGGQTSSLPGEVYQTWVEPARDGMQIPSGVDSSRYPANDGRIETMDESSVFFNSYRGTTAPPVPTPNKIAQHTTPKQDEYYSGGLPVFYIPNQGLEITTEPTCGKVLRNREEGRNLKSTSTLDGQWPWQIAIYQQQTSVDFRYICGGTLISKRHVITAAHCVTKKSSTKTVNKNTLTVYLGKHNLRNSVEGVQVRFVSKVHLYPEYNETNFNTDLAILELRENVSYSDRIQPACLWPEHETDLENIVGKTGSIVGWGYEVTGLAREELSLLQMAVVDKETCIRSYAEFFRRFTSERTYCAGYRDSGTACNGDSGGGMVFQKGDTWYLRGVVSLSVAREGRYRCDPNHYVIFTDVARFLPWIQENIED